MQAIRQALRDAVKLCRRVQATLLVANTKASGRHQEPVTIADYGSQAIICRALQAHYPADAVVSEESGEQFLQLVPPQQRAQVLELLSQALGMTVSEAEVVNWLDFGKDRRSRRTWVIDPIDGTKGFIARRHYAIACGLLLDGRVAEGMLAAPGYGDGEGALFYTRDGESWREGMAGGKSARLTVSTRKAAGAIVAAQSYARAHASKSRMRQAREWAGFGAARVMELDSMEKYALVACGDADFYLRLPRQGSEYAHKIWDHAAGVALVTQAGGMTTGLDGEPLDFSRGDSLPNAGLIVSSGQHHQRLVEAVGRVMAQGATS